MTGALSEKCGLFCGTEPAAVKEVLIVGHLLESLASFLNILEIRIHSYVRGYHTYMHTSTPVVVEPGYCC